MGKELVWGLADITYIFLGGLAAGAFFISALFVLRRTSNDAHFTAARYGALLAPAAAIVGGLVLSTELSHPFRVWRVYLNFANGWESPMFYGAWLLTLFIGTSVLYAFTFLRKDAAADDGWRGARRALAYIGLAIGFALGLYYGVLHAVMPARPFWNTPILPLLFLFSAYVTGIAGVILLRGLLHRQSDNPEIESRYQASGYPLLAWVLTLVVGQLVLIALFILFGAGFGTLSVRQAVSVVLPGGPLALGFWAWVVVVGMIVPALIAWFYMTPRLFNRGTLAVPRAVEIVLPVALLFGGYMLRYVVVVAGQITGPVGI
jgi:formate-dependent nitrite reductase membrane component NrfD